MIAYKGTANLQCRNQTYQVGGAYTHNEELRMCVSGFHFCETLYQINTHYPFRKKENIYFEIEVLGKIIKEEDKCVTNKFKVLRIIPRTEFNLIEPKHFDKYGNLIYFERFDGYWSKRTYDENNNIIYFEDSFGYWFKSKYNKNNDEIYFEDSKGSWHKSEYDQNNNMIFFQDSNGYWCKKEYNENNKLIRIYSTTGQKEQ